MLSLTWCISFALCAQQSVLQTGEWYKLSIEKPGVYKISFDFLKKMGVDPEKINPEHIKLYGNRGGMLPQANDAPRPADIAENAIFVEGEADGIFNKTDYILFYGEGPDRIDYDLTRQVFYYQSNLYSDKNFYFLTVGDDPGKRIVSNAGIDGSFPLVTTYEDLVFHEEDNFNVEQSGREWFGEKFGISKSHVFNFNLPGIKSGSTMKIISDVMGQTYTEASFRIFVNNTSVAEQKVLPIANSRYALKGIHRRDTISIAATDVNAESRSSQEIRYEFVKGSGFSQGYLDFMLLQVTRDLALFGNQTIFRSPEALQHQVSTFEVKNVSSDVNVWDITDPANVTSQPLTFAESAAWFNASTQQLHNFIVFNHTVSPPVFVARVENQNLRGLASPNIILITHPAFANEAIRLAAHRESQDNWSTQVVSTDQIFNEFSSGRQDVSALRDFIKHLRDKSPSTLKAILLFGKGSYDYKDRVANNTNFVPTYQSRNSLHPLQTYSSDDYFAFLEGHEGLWNESPAQHHTLDAAVGRLPVTTVEEAKNVVDKIIYYDTSKKTYGAWRKKIVFVADDGNSEDGFTSLHQYQADQLASAIESINPSIDSRKIFMGSYQKRVQPNGESVPDMADDIKRAFDQGALIINFTGHGSEVVWADERILTDNTLEELTNERYPFLVTATCEFGRQDDPRRISSAERAVLRKNAGAIGLVTTARPVNATTNFNLNEAFYESLFEPIGQGYATIGEVFRNTKNNSTSGVANRNFSLIGDPSMTLVVPDHTVQVTEVKTAMGSDTLKALSTVTTKGFVQSPEGDTLDSFNGIVEVTLFDKETESVTTGKNNPPFSYRQWKNALFRGQASVKNGVFEFDFIMPKNISYEVGKGKFSMYAFDPQSGIEAKGVNNTVRIGGTETGVPSDITPPEIKLFISDTTFVNGGVTTPDTYLVAQISDNSGINISGYDIGNSIVAVLDDDDQTFVLNDYFITDRDKYQRGTLRFPMLGLTPGKHSLTLKVWDAHNNPAQATIEFMVTDGEILVIESFGNYPNPFEENTTLFFTHNRSGDDLEAQLFIYSPAGELINSSELFLAASEYSINLTELRASDGSGKKLSPGLYLARLIVRSMSNGSKNEKVTKLIVLN